LFDEDQLLEVVVCSKNANIGKCVIDLRSLPRETTHRLWNKFEDCIGEIYLLLTISGTTASETISDLTTHREDEHGSRNLAKKYVKITFAIRGIDPKYSLNSKMFLTHALGTSSILSEFT
jgi:hypothetical protein